MQRSTWKRSWEILLVAVVAIFFVAIIGRYYYHNWSDLQASNTSATGADSGVIQAVTDLEGILTDTPFPAEGQYCLTCHQGIEPTRPMGSGMMQAILAKGAALGDPNGCVVCHGGTPSEVLNKDRAHSGVPNGSPLKAFTPVPAALQVNENTCGLCHSDHVYNSHLSMMNSDAGKMKAIAWSFGIGTENKDHIYANHDLRDTDGDTPRFGTETYIAYMKEMAATFPGQYPTELKQVPAVTGEEILTHPERAAFTYLRNCNACHLSNKGHQDRGHYRGMGCAACHSLYSNEGYYEGGDTQIDRKTPGHLLVHAMQGTRKSKTIINGHEVSGIQVSTCAACHAAGRRIGHSYQGLMALDISSGRGPFDKDGLPQKTNAGYVFKYIRSDAHHRIDVDGKSVTGLLCQDCHTTNGMHGNGNIEATSLAQVEIECADCHGTGTHYPWELPIGYGDEFHKKLDMSKGRGVANEPLRVTQEFGITYPKEDGYLLSSRGNPLGNVIRRGNKVIVHSDTGRDFEVPTIKGIKEANSWKTKDKGYVAMVQIAKHMESLECYACHSTWVPQYYGYKYVLDYTKNSPDWLASPEHYDPDGTTLDYHQRFITQEGVPTSGDYSHIRWEAPPLGINGEGRVSPLVGVIQTISTVIGPDGKVVVWNNVAKTKEGYNAMELAPVQPHTISLEARECADCHGDDVAAGYGIDGGVYDAEPNLPRYADVVSNDGENVSHFTEAQIQAIKELHGDFMQLITKEGKQVQTIDSHWPTSMPLTKEQREVLSRKGTCLACHVDIPDGTIPNRMLTAVAKVANLNFKSEEAHHQLLHQNNLLIAWIKALGVVALILLVPILIILYIKRKQIIAALHRLFNKQS